MSIARDGPDSAAFFNNGNYSRRLVVIHSIACAMLAGRNNPG